MQHTPVSTHTQGHICFIRICRPEHRNAVDGDTARGLAAAMRSFEADPQARVAILSGDGEHFCAGADLKAFASGDPSRHNPLQTGGDGPMGPSRMQLSKPVIAAVDGYCVAGGLELALWCDLRVATERAVFGVFCRRFGVPLIDGGSVRLPRLIGHSRAMDMILTGRAVGAQEALSFGLVNRLTANDQLMPAASELAQQIARHPQQCLRNDRLSALEQWSLNEDEALKNEFSRGQHSLASGEALSGAKDFSSGAGRHGGSRRDDV